MQIVAVGVTNRHVLQKARSIALVVPFGKLRRTCTHFLAITDIQL